MIDIEDVRRLEKFLYWFEKEGYFVQCHYDEYTIVTVNNASLIDSYKQYIEEEKQQ